MLRNWLKNFKQCLVNNNLDQYGALMRDHWNLKKKKISNNE